MYRYDHGRAVAPMLFLAVALSFSLVGACGGDGSGPAGAVDLTGDWVGTIQSSQVPAGTEVNLTLSQTGGTVTGTYLLPFSGMFGDVAGTVTGSSVTFTLTQKNVSCPGSFSGSGTVTGNSMTFTYSGSDCWGIHADGQGSATRQ
jgi:hypothetical protein